MLFFLRSHLTFTPHIAALTFLFPAWACEWTLPHPSLYYVRWSSEPWYDWPSSKPSLLRLAIQPVTRLWLVTISLHVSPEYRAHWGTTGFKTGDARFVTVLLFIFSWVCACQWCPDCIDRGLLFVSEIIFWEAEEGGFTLFLEGAAVLANIRISGTWLSTEGQKWGNWFSFEQFTVTIYIKLINIPATDRSWT